MPGEGSLAMLDFMESLRALLKSDSTVYTAVGDRIYPDQAKKGAAFPFIVYELDSETELASFETPTNTLRTATVTISCYYEESPTGAGGRRTAARTLANAVAAKLRNYSGTISGGVTVSGTDSIELRTGFPQDESGDFRMVSMSVGCNIWYYL
jgi:hypothetical protein